MILQSLLSRMSFCSLIGTLAGLNAGFWASIAQVLYPNVVWSNSDMIMLGLAAGLFAFICISVCLIGFFRYTAGSVLLPTLVNVFLVTAATILVVNWLQIPVLNCLIGFLIGWIIGWILCRFCTYRFRELTHAG